MNAELDGPRIAASSGTTKQLVVFLHGYGADGSDLIELGRLWQPLLPDTAFVSPDAPEPCAEAPIGRQWFGLTRRDPNERWLGVQRAAPVLDRFIDAELARVGVAQSALALVGFSQGTMMALHVGLRRATPPAAIVGYSGLLAAPNQTDVAAMAHEIISRPPVLLIHGDSDPLIPPQALPMSATALRALGLNVETHMSSGVGHGIGEDGLRLGVAFLEKAFAK
jgi:phospholipase/carboxylesterase